MEKKGKVLFVRTPPYDVNPNTYNMQQVGIGRAFCDKGYDYDFITFKKKDPKEWVFYEKDGCVGRYIEKPRLRLLRWGINTSLCDPAFLKQYDLIICQEYYQLQTYLMSRRTDRLAVYSGPYYNMFMPKCLSPIYDALFAKKLSANVRRIFVKSILAKEYLEKKGYTGVQNVGVAIDTSRYADVRIAPETQKLADYMRENRCLLYVGALSSRKNYPFLLEVYRAALKIYPDLKLVTIGAGKASAMQKLTGKKDSYYPGHFDVRLTDAERSGITHIKSMDNAQLKFIYPMAKVFLLPSLKEIFGMVLLEALYFGAPTVSSRNGGSLTLMPDERYGQIVEPFDVDLWVKAIRRFMDDEAYTRSVIDAARGRIESDFVWDRIVEQFMTAM